MNDKVVLEYVAAEAEYTRARADAMSNVVWGVLVSVATLLVWVFIGAFVFKMTDTIQGGVFFLAGIVASAIFTSVCFVRAADKEEDAAEWKSRIDKLRKEYGVLQEGQPLQVAVASTS